MNETPAVLIVDVETTGFDPRREQIIELAFQYGLESDSPKEVFRFKPTCKISPRATAVHGISEQDLAGCPSISESLGLIRDAVHRAEFIVGYNVQFDLEFILAEFERHKQPPPPLDSKEIIDPLELWRKCEPRNLSAAVARFSKRDHSTAHSALGDVEATAEVLQGMRKAFGVENKTLKELADFICPPRKAWVGPSYHIIWTDDAPCFGFGKHKGRSLTEMALAKDDYLNWVLKTDFPPHVKGIVQNAIELESAEFMVWVKTTYAP